MAADPLSLGFGSLGFGLLGTGAGIYSANRGASAQRGASADATEQFIRSKEEAHRLLNPWSQAGGSALSPLTGLLTGQSYDYKTGQTTQLNQQQRQDLFQQSPGYQFRLEQGMKAIQAGQAAQGNLLSGGGAKELQQFGQGLAGDDYGNYLEQLFKFAQMGQQADTAKANASMGVASGLAESAFSGGMANANKFNSFSNAGFGLAGQAFGNMMGGGGSKPPSGGGGSGGGQYNSAMMGSSMGSSMGPLTSLMGG